MNNYCIITTINSPTKAIEKLYEHFGNRLLIVGDKKTPEDWVYKGIRPMMEKKIYAPDNSYARKNLGYMTAIQNKADLIYETDDDNIPKGNFKIRTLKTKATHTSNDNWCNVYQPLTSGLIWPRGFPLSLVKDKPKIFELNEEKECPIQQGLADISPDVDAIWRLTDNREVYFWLIKSIYLKETWCPFNSQSTWWFPEAFPLMYLPVTASFRMCDIWRSFVAQRCLWELGKGVAFHSPSEVCQERNKHNLMADFKDEIPGYLNNDGIIAALNSVVLHDDKYMICENLLTCYEVLVNEGFLAYKELSSVKTWISDYRKSTANLG